MAQGIALGDLRPATTPKDIEGQVVIAPRPWLTRADLDTRDLLPVDWLTLDREGDDRHVRSAAATPTAAAS